jgi:hypothetical protein
VLGNAYAIMLIFNGDTKLALKGKGRFINRPTTTGGKKYDKYFVYIPTELANDSQFPFKVGDTIRIVVNVKARKMILEKT